VKVSQGERFRRGLAPAAGLVLAALLALPAGAAAGTKSKSAAAAGNKAIATATAKCPRGQLATGGGFAAPPATAVPFILVYESRKLGQRSWRASGQIFDAGPTGPALTLTAFVYCSDGAPSTKARSASVTSVAGPLMFYTADARCNSGKAQAGGFLGPPPNIGGGASHTVADSLRADKKTWRSRMRSGTPGTTFTSYVYCADEKKPAARFGSATSASVALATALSAQCRRGTRPVAGGFSQPNATLSPFGFFSAFYESFKSGKRWRISTAHSGTASTTLNSIAYCA
jgi:hypothetical protein